MNYFQRLRIEWAFEMFKIYGYVGPTHLIRKFEISQAQASKDFKIIRQQNAGVYYDVQKKSYRIQEF